MVGGPEGFLCADGVDQSQPREGTCPRCDPEFASFDHSGAAHLSMADERRRSGQLCVLRRHTMARLLGFQHCNNDRRKSSASDQNANRSRAGECRSFHACANRADRASHGASANERDRWRPAMKLSCYHSRKSGSMLIIVMWVTFGLVALAVYFANSMSIELRAADNRVAATEAEQAILG